MPTTTLNLRTSRSLPEILRLLAQLPATLTGTVADPAQLRHYFLGSLLQNLLALIVQAFLHKSRGGTDSLGCSWAPLTARTLARKWRAQTKRAPHFLDPLSTSQRSQWAALYHQSFSHLRSLGLRGDELVQSARQGAWLQLVSSGARSGAIPVNIASGALLASLQPGQLTGSSYQPPPHQHVTVTAQGLQVRFTLPYTSYVHAKRPLYPPPDTMQPWIRQSTAAALTTTLNQLQGALA